MRRPRTSHGTWALPLAVVVALGPLSACASSETAQAAPAVSTSAAPLDLVPPTVMPAIKDEARQQTEAGATAFVLFWFDLLNWSLATNDVDALAPYTNGGCSQCNGWLIGISRRKDEGALLKGGLTAPLTLAIGPFSPTEPVVFRADYLNTAGVVTGPDSSAASYPSAQTSGTLTVVWGTNGWQMAAVELVNE